MLKLYQNPRTFPLKFLRYETVDEMMLDRDVGVELRLVMNTAELPAAKLSAVQGAGVILAERIPDFSRAAAAGVFTGDVLEAVTNDDTGQFSSRQPPPLVLDVFDSLVSQGQFPLTLEFRGSAAAQILASDGWTPCHGAAGRAAAPQQRRVLQNLVAAAADAIAAQDVCGCTPKDWFTLCKEHEGYAVRAEMAESEGGRSLNGSKRAPPARPLSAGSRGAIIAKGLQEGSLHPVSRPSSAKSRVSSGASRPTSASAASRPTSAASRPQSALSTRPGSAKSRASGTDCESVARHSANDGVYRVWEARCQAAAHEQRVRDPEARSTKAEDTLLHHSQRSCPPAPVGVPDFVNPGISYARPVF
eukprot:TRINITY_DN23813_c0_g1_i4.p1 TRINITY_DN23813_c0_g1~~TRINITY_DN23813_c0_g1_i4.p1  ORF type:complete len:360 (-),score=58.63 TRINITY_DN23813_c0_g1_i4:226-1305(-)